MKIQPFVQILTGLAIALGVTPSFNQPSYAIGIIFYCDQSNSTPTTFVRTEDGKKLPFIRWVGNYGSSQEWTPEKRCQEVSRRFQINYERGTFKHIITGAIRGVPVICAARSQSDRCTDRTLLFSLKPGTNPNDTLRKLLDRRALAAGNALDESGGNKRIYIDLDRYLNILNNKFIPK
ncbi:hypothetical protein NIES4075_36410 [Tolypothrix sp. NIES-4075]|uniref:COP23 domain-containing protein n=1 Tax=Tolypothrix sp. NIES-4075 TaxID=2005459 RepID=UPI000B5CC889|nr:COP23 domain-containing protein [Tolypothrix sp. NIES-4075]GAX42638.1 hypothetical protein NIES4075_36410 [Tolypothrix sp. NIES-4075]